MRARFKKLIFFLETDFPRVLLILIPYGASFIPASLLYGNLRSILQISPLPALIIAASTEGIGILCAALYLKIKKFNHVNSAQKHQQKTIYIIIAYLIYITAVIMTNAFLDFKNQPPEITIARILLSLLSVSGALIFASNFSMATTESEIITAKAERKQAKAKSQQTKAESQQTKAKTEQAEAEADSLGFACTFPSCDFVGKSQNSLNAHSRKHKKEST